MSAWVSPSIVADQYSASPFQGQLVEVAAQARGLEESGRLGGRAGGTRCGAGGGGGREQAGPVLVNNSILMSERGT